MASENSRSTLPMDNPFDPNMWYQLKNSHLPSTHCLDVINDNGNDSLGLLQIAEDGYYAGQYWQFKPNADGTYVLGTWWLPNRQLDVYTHDPSTPILLPAQEITSQRWRVEAWGDGTWKLGNGLSGKGAHCLDTVDEGGRVTVKMKAADEGRSTQRWTIRAIREITEAERRHP